MKIFAYNLVYKATPKSLIKRLGGQFIANQLTSTKAGIYAQKQVQPVLSVM
jgi:hypothetical protein